MTQVKISKNEQKRLLKAEQKKKSKTATETQTCEKKIDEGDMDATQYEEFRKNTIEKMQQKGYNPYVHEFNYDINMETFLERYSDIEIGTHLNELISISGRVYAKRASGSKLVFFDIMSQNKKIQILANANFYESLEKFQEIVEFVKLGDTIGVIGYPGKSKLGETSLIPKTIQILSPCYTQMPHLHFGLKDQESRYRNRSLDMLMNPQVNNRFQSKSEIIRFLQLFFENLGFQAVETPIMAMIPGGAAAKPFMTHHDDFNCDMYLRIAPELYLKQCVIGGIHRVYEIGKQFRNESADLTHNPEFTTMEFYMAYADYFDLIKITEDLLSSLVMKLFGTHKVNYTKDEKVIEIDFTPPYKQIDMMSGLEEALGIKFPLPTELHSEEARQFLDRVCLDNNVECSHPRTTSRLLDKLVGEYLEVKCINPTFIMNHPVIMSPLAKGHRSVPGLTERFEMFVMKKELCNAYSELNDPFVQRERFEQQAKDKAAGDEEAMFVDESFLEALEYGMPPTAGWGLGIDRLAMFLTDTESIKEVIPFPTMKPELDVKKCQDILAMLELKTDKPEQLLNTEQKKKSRSTIEEKLDGNVLAANQYRELSINTNEKMRQKGYNPYVYVFQVDITIERFLDRYSGIEIGTHLDESISISGRVYAKRETQSKLVFFEIMSQNRKLQVLPESDFLESIEKFREIVEFVKLGDTIGVIGHPAKSQLGEVCIIPKTIEILSPCCKQFPDSGIVLKDEESRYRNRSLDMLMNPGVYNRFQTRIEIIKYLHLFAGDLGFRAVETPVLGMVPSGAAAKPFMTHYNHFNCDVYLRMAPELHLKQFIIGGNHRVYEIGKQFRNRSADLADISELTTMELYMAYESYFYMINFTEELLSSLVMKLFGTHKVNYTKDEKVIEIDFTPPYKQIDMMSGLEEALGIKLPLPTELHSEEARQFLDRVCLDNNVECLHPRTTSRLLDKLVGKYLKVKCVNPTFIMNYPEIMSPLAKGHRSVPGLTERFELFALNIEMCNGSTELNNPFIQKERFEQQAKDRAAGDEEAMFVDESFLEALKLGMPPTAGWRLYIDRLTMFLTDAVNIKEVILFPTMEPELY